VAGYSDASPCTGVLLEAPGAAVTTVVITGTAGQFSCAAASLFVGQQLTISGTFGGTGSITGYVNPTTYLISATNGTTTFTLVTLTGAALVTTAGTPTGLTYTTVGGNQCANGVIGYTVGAAYDSLLYGVYVQFAGTAATLTITGMRDNFGNAASLLVSGSTTVDYFWMPPVPILNSFAAFTFTPSVAGKIWVFTRCYTGPERPETRVTD